MATQKVVVEGSSGVTASQLKDLFRQIDDGSIGGSHMQAFIEHRDAWGSSSAPTRAQKKLLGFVVTASVGAIESFKASDHFKIDTKKEAAWIAWIGDKFEKNFIGKTEDASGAADLKIHKLLESSLDAPIIAELADKCEITLGHFYTLLSKQGKGETGPLLTNGLWNIAYIRDVKGILWAVFAFWYSSGGGWSVSASSVEDSSKWHDGFQVVSR